MQRFGGGLAVLHHRDADVAVARIGAVGLRPRRITSWHHAHASLFPKFSRHHLAAALLADIEPEEKSTRWTLVPITVADDLVGEIEFRAIERAVFLHMRLVVIRCDRDLF